MKDRHNGNILIDDQGHIIHIDFGFIFDISPANNMRFENADFKLTKEMAAIMGGKHTEAYRLYETLCVQAFLAVRRFGPHIVHTISLMYRSGLKCFLPQTHENLLARFMPQKTDLQAAKEMRLLIERAYDRYTTNIYDMIQYFQNKIEH